MLAFLLGSFRFIWLFGKGSHALVLENLALRQQLAIYKRKQNRPRLVGRDRWFWIVLSVVWKAWRRALLVVHPDTVVRWQRERFRRYWAQRSKKSGRTGRPAIGLQIRTLIRTLAQANPLWRAPRIHGELLKLGFEVSERTVSRVLRTVKRPPSTNLENVPAESHRGNCRSRLFHRTNDPPASAICVSGDRASTQEGPFLWGHRTSDCRMDGSTNGRSLF